MKIQRDNHFFSLLLVMRGCMRRPRAVLAQSPISRTRPALSTSLLQCSARRNFSQSASNKPKKAKEIIDTSEPGSGEILREFISKSLYSKTSGYFNTVNCINTSPAIDFPSLVDAFHYRSTVSNLYKMFPDAWLTPSELFKPWYSRAVAQWIVQTKLSQSLDQYAEDDEAEDSDEPLYIFEVGGGSGTCAVGILDYLATYHPGLYERTQYRIIEISTQFSEMQTHRLGQAGHGSRLARIPIITLMTLMTLVTRITLSKCYLYNQLIHILPLFYNPIPP